MSLDCGAKNSVARNARNTGAELNRRSNGTTCSARRSGARSCSNRARRPHSSERSLRSCSCEGRNSSRPLQKLREHRCRSYLAQPLAYQDMLSLGKSNLCTCRFCTLCRGGKHCRTIRRLSRVRGHGVTGRRTVRARRVVRRLTRRACAPQNASGHEQKKGEGKTKTNRHEADSVQIWLMLRLRLASPLPEGSSLSLSQLIFRKRSSCDETSTKTHPRFCSFSDS